ncbi:K+-transporting ATPase subunit F [Mycobacteroides abscessus]|nr:ATPase [Mycobacteroides abscessus]EIU35986.1 K+-transporting ATPase, F subunit [Mycobacteroides abscessus 6G-0125-S]EIU38635.1 K+-transporting ATPase, F subunit [Mycobacteroides abscessus 6G-0125-R]EIU52893.1 K+-transporting ATPase, F subunit [Mycobacteroides abscessus 6G-0728-S]EIU55018.1 K+-transporting ATPase, F subunit [Mycobacteroides abscessus 6G-1108]EIU88460.1 K+-transporting ATPase, F subunit [Mycobacteroides abscessus 6G-0212]EIU94550.1 K+-transporting ATPase, F subunit [Mycobact
MRRCGAWITGAVMSGTVNAAVDILLIVLSAALVVYLVVALLDPERF